jgi:hypothetical protein
MGVLIKVVIEHGCGSDGVRLLVSEMRRCEVVVEC